MRKPRFLQDGACYHVTARANRREFILIEPKIKEQLVEVILRARRKFGFELLNYCIMSNHIHLMIQPKSGTSLSRIMQWILSVFAMGFNRRFGYVGHVWYDRFHSSVLSSFVQSLRTFLYIADNPLRAGMVARAGEYLWSGVRELLLGMPRLLGPPPAWIGFVTCGMGLPPALPAPVPTDAV